jgi:hypothetical protein
MWWRKMPFPRLPAVAPIPAASQSIWAVVFPAAETGSAQILADDARPVAVATAVRAG